MSTTLAPAMPDLNYVLDHNPEDQQDSGWFAEYWGDVFEHYRGDPKFKKILDEGRPKNFQTMGTWTQCQEWIVRLLADIGVILMEIISRVQTAEPNQPLFIKWQSGSNLLQELYVRIEPMGVTSSWKMANDEITDRMLQAMPVQEPEQRSTWRPQMPERAIQDSLYYHRCPMCGGYLQQRGDFYTCQGCPWEYPQGGEKMSIAQKYAAGMPGYVRIPFLINQDGGFVMGYPDDEHQDIIDEAVEEGYGNWDTLGQGGVMVEFNEETGEILDMSIVKPVLGSQIFHYSDWDLKEYARAKWAEWLNGDGLQVYHSYRGSGQTTDDQWRQSRVALAPPVQPPAMIAPAPQVAPNTQNTLPGGQKVTLPQTQQGQKYEPVPLNTPSFITFNGGTVFEQRQVIEALDASSFNFAVVGQVTVNIVTPGTPYADDASPGSIQLAAVDLDKGVWSWGMILHELGHQVDFALLNDQDRSNFLLAFKMSQWWTGNESDTGHKYNGGEIFADMVSCAYWTTQANWVCPGMNQDELHKMMPMATFQQMLNGMISGDTKSPSVQGFPALAPAGSSEWGNWADTTHFTGIPIKQTSSWKIADGDNWFNPQSDNYNQGVDVPGNAPGMNPRGDVPADEPDEPEIGTRTLENNWVYLEGKVKFGHHWWEIVGEMVRDAGFDETTQAYIANTIARNALPQDLDIAVGSVRGDKIQIWASTVDRNSVWDAVSDAKK